MDLSSFWLISIEESCASVSLLTLANNQYHVTAAGSQKNWSEKQEESLDIAVDESLSEAAGLANIPEDQEPVLSAFVLPPFWVGSDGKIVPQKLKLIENLCKNLNLKPIGFIANDEAIIEEFNQADGFPASFILLYLDNNCFTLSLAYLGHIKERIKKSFEGEFNAQYVESALLELKSESTLPPQIIVFGQVEPQVLSNLKNFAWVGKKNIETFLHFPDIKYYQHQDVVNIFAKIIVSQIKPDVSSTNIKVEEPEVVSETVVETDETNLETELVTEPELDVEEFESVDLNEVAPDDLGFSVKKEEVDKLPVIEAKDLPLFNQSEEIINNPTVEPELSQVKPKFTVPRIKLPFGSVKNIKRLKPSFINSYHLLFVLAFIPLLLLVPVFLLNAKVTLFVTPFSFNKQVSINLTTSSKSIDSSTGMIPVTKKEFTVSASTSQKTTGQKTIGDKAKGNIVVYNILGKAQSLPKGSVLTDASGKKFELTESVSVAASSFDIDAGILKPGQTKAMATASDIGPEYNVGKDTKLQFKDFSENSIIAKVSDAFTGGTKKQINAVSEQDKKDLSQKIDESISESIDGKINSELSNIPGIIRETIKTKKDRIEFSREVGEEADELSATADASVTVFVLDSGAKEQIVNSFLSKEPDFSKVEIQPSSFELEYKIDKIESESAKGNLTIKGTALPKIDIPKLKKELVAKSKTEAGNLIKKEVQRAYNYNINTNIGLFFMPLRTSNITVNIKTESL